MSHWRQKKREIDNENDSISLKTLETAVNVCSNGNSADKCKQCFFSKNGCSDRIGIILQDRIRHLPDFGKNERANAVDRSFDVCFSDGTPQRCWKCDFDYHKDKGCWQELYKTAIAVIKGRD